MKYFSILLLSVLTIFSCSKEEVPDDGVDCREVMDCSGDCLFELYNKEGVVHYYNCYETWGILYIDPLDDPGAVIALIPDLPEEFKVEDKAVVFSATFFVNNIPLSFPDPMPGAFYRAELCEIE